MRIRAAARSDLPALADLMAASPLLQRYGVTARHARASLAEAMREGDLVLVAAEGGVVRGVAWLILTRAFDGAAYLRLLLVAEGEQSRGVGAALLSRAERRAREARSRHLALLVTGTNRRARNFYEREGYRLVGILPGYVRPGIDEALYVKDCGSSRK